MKNNRRDFLKIAGLAGLSLPAANALYAHSLEDEKNFNDLPRQIEEFQKKHKQRFNMSGYAAPKIDTVRIGIIGTGNRGSHHAGTISRVSDVEINAAADLDQSQFERIKKNLENLITIPNTTTVRKRNGKSSVNVRIWTWYLSLPPPTCMQKWRFMPWSRASM
jgi:hypothetical protein